MKTKVFLSYAHKDSAKVVSIVQDLQKYGFDVWIDRQNIKGGELWSEEIARAIRKCHYYVLLVSKASTQSDSIRREVHLAHLKNRKMILLRLDATEIPDEIAFQTIGVQWIDTKDDDWMPRLLVALGGKSPSSVSRPKNYRSKPQSKRESGNTVQIQGNATGNIIIVGNENTVNRNKSS